MARKRKPKPDNKPDNSADLEACVLREVRRNDAWEDPKANEDLERQADRILQASQATILSEIQALRECYESLKMPSNDPEYLAKLQGTEKARAEIANRVTAVHIVPDPQDIGRKWISLGLVDPRNPGEALETARQLGAHLEAKVINHETD